MHRTFIRAVAAVIAVLVMAFVLTACGGGSDTTSSASASPEEVTKSFLTAIANGDGETACSYASANAISTIEQGGGTCAEQATSAAGQVTEDDKQDVEQATYEASDMTDTTATVTATKPNGQSESFKLVLEDGSWKIDQ